MSRIKPYSGKSLDRLVTELLTANDLHLDYGKDFLFSPPRSISPDSAQRNTEVTFTPLIWDGQFEEQVLSYTRLNLNVLKHLPPGSILEVRIPTLPVNARRILPQINEALGLDLIAEEIEDTRYPPDVLRTGLKVKIDPSKSYGWIGEIILQAVLAGSMDLNDLILQIMLGILPNPQSYGADQAYIGRDELLGLIIAANEPAGVLVGTDVTFSLPRLVDPTGNDLSNTRIIVSGAINSNFYGGVEVFYNRYLLSMLGRNGDLAFLVEQPFTEADVVAYLNSATNAHLTIADIEPFSYGAMDIGTTGTITVRASSTSLVWSGSLDVPFIYGLTPMVDKLHIHMNFTLPSPGYLT